MKTPFIDKNGKQIEVGHILIDNDKDGELVTVHFGEYIAGHDDWGVDFVCYGFYIVWSDGTAYSLTQNGKGYSKDAGKLLIQS
jgi:hypothetical protein